MTGTEVRKVQAGRGHLFLHLPLLYCRALGIEKGDYVAVELWPKHMVIRPLDLHAAITGRNSRRDNQEER